MDWIGFSVVAIAAIWSRAGKPARIRVRPGREGAMSYTPMAEHRTIVVVDVAGFNAPQRKLVHQFTVHEGLFELLERAFRACGIDWDECLVENTGDGALVLPPAGVPKGRVADELPGRVLAELLRYNAVHNDAAGVRLRMALNAGEVLPSGPRAVSPAISAACRILDSAEAKVELKRTGATLAVIASDGFFQDVIAQDPAAEPQAYREIPVHVKETDTRAWLRLHGGDREGPLADSSQAPSAATRPTNRVAEAVHILLEIPALQEPYGRQLLLDSLSVGLRAAVSYHPQARLHLLSLVRTCQRFGNGLTELAAAVATIDPGSPAAAKLADLVRTWSRG
jgi:hypothetical protein